VRWLQRPSWEDDWKDVRGFLMRHADLRLVDLLLYHLSEGSGEVADFVVEQFLPVWGAALLPDLLPRLEQGDRRSRARVLRAVCGIDGRRGADLCRPRLNDADANVRFDALRCLTVAAPDEARRTALAWLEGRPPMPVVAAAWKCLHELRPFKASDLPALLRALPRGRSSGAPAVVASVGRAAVRPLTEMLRSADGAERDAAIDALRHLGPKAAPAVPQLLDLLSERNEEVVSSVLWALSEMGDAARAAVPSVIELVARHDTEAGLGWSAANALAKIGADDPAAITALVARLESKKSDVVFNAVSRLGEIGPAARAAVPHLVALYQHQSSHWQFRMHILETLAGIGPGATEARPLLEKVLGDREIRLRYAAALALGMLGPTGKAAVPVLIEAMHDARDSWWWTMHADQVVRALGAIGPAAAAAGPDLAEITRTALNERRRRAAREALARIRGKRGSKA
jgi:HEAT repeat protein